MTRVSLDANGLEYGANSIFPKISPYGRFVTFATKAALLPYDNNAGLWDIYLIDTTNGSLELISKTTQGISGNQASFVQTDFSDDGRMVAFESSATDLVPGLGNFNHAFVRDRALGLTRLVSVSSTGVEGDCFGPVRISGDGRYVAFASYYGPLFPGDVNNRFDVFVHDLQSGTTELVSISTTGTTGNDDSGPLGPDISRDGRFVVFESKATNLVSGYTPAFQGIYLRDRGLGITSVISKGLSGQPSNGKSGDVVCSDDGQIIAFWSEASNLVPGDTNGQTDVFVHNVASGRTDRVSVSSTSVQSNGWSAVPALSPDGRYVAFSSIASNLVPGDTNGVWDVFLHDRVAQQLERISVNAGGIESNGDSSFIALSRDAAELVFHSGGSNLVPLDNNASSDVFYRKCSPPTGYCTPKINSLGCQPTMSTSGIPMASGSQGFFLEAQQVLNQKPGLLIYSTAGQNAAPFAGGTLCVLPPVRRTPGQISGGSIAGTDCTGTLSFDFNAWIATGSNPALVPGATVWAQYWSRDPGFPPPFNAGLTDAQTFVIWP